MDEAQTLLESVGAFAEIYEKAGEYRLAVRTYQVTYRVGLGRVESAALHNGITCRYAKLGHCRKAVSHSRRAVELEPDNAAHMSDFGYRLLEARNPDEARTAALERAAELGPADELAGGNLAHCLSLMNRKGQGGTSAVGDRGASGRHR